MGTIEGPAGTVRRHFRLLFVTWLSECLPLGEQVYAGLKFKISISFPPNYPMAPPAMKFESPCFHPNVDINAGGICLDILQVSLRCAFTYACGRRHVSSQDKWSAVYSVQTILLSLQSLLGGASCDLPLRIILLTSLCRAEQRIPAQSRCGGRLGFARW